MILSGLPNRNSEKILRFRVVAEKVHSAQPKRFTRRARHTASLKSGGGGGGGGCSRTQYEKIRRFVQKSVFFRRIPRSRKKSVDSAINLFFKRSNPYKTDVSVDWASLYYSPTQDGAGLCDEQGTSLVKIHT